MKKFFICLAVAASAGALSNWKEYPLEVPAGFKSIYAVTVNAAGSGCAFIHDGASSGKQYTLVLRNGVWSPGVSPAVHLARPSISPDGTVYSVNDSGSGIIYRYGASGWEKVALPERVSCRVFHWVAAVGPREFWVKGATADNHCVVAYFENDQPRLVFKLGPLDETGSGPLAVPRTATPNGDCYGVVHSRLNPYGSYKWQLFILHTNGTFEGYGFPLENHNCDGLTLFQPGDVRVMFTAYNSGPSRLYGFANGVFREVVSFPERVIMKSQPTPSDGWGFNSAANRIYHWTGVGVSPAVNINGQVVDLDMVSASEGWAVGCKISNGVYTPAMWHYSDVEPSLTPTSLGRVKAAFR